MSAAHLTQKGIGSGPSSCYIILEGEQDVLWAPLTGASHVPGNPRLAHTTYKRFRILHARVFIEFYTQRIGMQQCSF